MSRVLIKLAYDKLAKEKGHVHISDVAEMSGLTNEEFGSALGDLTYAGNVELETGHGQWNDSKVAYEYDGQEFFGMKWVRDLSAFELVWHFRSEIVAEWNETGSEKDAVSKASELTGLKSDTVKTHIRALPFLCAELGDIQKINDTIMLVKSENSELKQRIRQLESAHEAILKELDTKTGKADKLRSENETLRIQLAEAERGTMVTKLINMQNQINALTAQFSALTSSKTRVSKIDTNQPDKPPNLKIGKWSLNPVKRGNSWFYRAFRTFPGDGSPKCVYVGADTTPAIVEEKLRKKGFLLYE